ncbi:2'-5' RNA ligase family protein [Rossellomorea sp. y25]|uniref:2'-5' RNA ligase family protein n=1 Tax=Rossellomorea sp. y25 TaxID=3118174 RepID=UPI0026088678|nr:2'-5' RNA ligase family protein [uncultured Rossellomorea sp.]
MKRAIHIFPQLESVEEIQRIRTTHDPLWDKIPPHITLVFPFTSNLSNSEIISHVQSIANRLQPFSLLLKEITGSSGEYLCLNVKRGNDSIIHSHDELYKGVLTPFRNPSFTYIPHITLGRIDLKEEFHRALKEYRNWSESFHTEVKEIVIEEINEQDVSNVISVIPLYSQHHIDKENGWF